MTERLIILVAVALAVLVLALVVRRVAAARVRQVEGSGLPAAVRNVLGPYDSGILYFYGPHCSTCAKQAAVLDSLEAQNLPIIRLDATVERAAAAELSVMPVPSTAVVDGGSVAGLN